MKKLILSAAILLGGFSAIAQEESVDATKEVKEVSATAAVAPATEAVQEEYTAITAEEIPAPVTAALETAYPGAEVETAHMNEAKEYKLDIAVDDQKATVYADAEGNWIQK